MASFKFLYTFSSPELDLVEIKRTDLEEGASLSQIYKWLVIPKNSQIVLELDFKSMDKGQDQEKREFLEGSLTFVSDEGSLALLGNTYQLKKTETAPKQVTEAVSKFLSAAIQNDTHNLRPLKPSDIVFFQKWIRDSEVIRYSMTKFHRFTMAAEITNWFSSTLFDHKTYQLGILAAEGELIGYAGISALNEIDGNGEFFILIGNKHYWGRGVASKVTKKIVETGFRDLELHRIFLTASSSNPGALKAYQKAGFVPEGKMREAFFRNGEYSDKIVMGLLRHEYEASSST